MHALQDFDRVRHRLRLGGGLHDVAAISPREMMAALSTRPCALRRPGLRWWVLVKLGMIVPLLFTVPPAWYGVSLTNGLIAARGAVYDLSIHVKP